MSLAQWAHKNRISPIKKEIIPGLQFQTNELPTQARLKKRERESPGSSQEWGKSGLRLKSCVFSKLATVAGLTSSGAFHPGTLISHHIMTYHNISHHIMTYHDISHHITPYHDIS